VTLAYDMVGHVVWRKDQTGTIIETEYNLGRVAHRRVTTFGSGIDDAVKRITYVPDAFSRMQTITQHNNAGIVSGTTAIDEVKYTYDDWGALNQIQQDRDSTVGTATGHNEFTVAFTTAKTT